MLIKFIIVSIFYLHSIELIQEVDWKTWLASHMLDAQERSVDMELRKK